MRLFARSALAAAVLALAAVAGPSGALAADRYIKVVNHTSVVLYSFYASLTNTNSWGKDRLVSKQIPPNYSSTLSLSDAPSGCYFDIRAVFKDGDVLEKFGINVCGGYTITYND